MPRYKDEPPAVRVYTVCDESKYLVVRNVPALGCGDQLKQLFGTYGEIEEFMPLDEEECEPFTDVYWIKFRQISNARFAKRKLDESVFLGNRLQVLYATQYENLSDTQEKLEGRRREVLARLKPGRSSGYDVNKRGTINETIQHQTLPVPGSVKLDSVQRGYAEEYSNISRVHHSSITRVSSDQDYFPSPSMNQTVRLVREKLDKIESSSSNAQAGPVAKKMRVDNRRRI